MKVISMDEYMEGSGILVSLEDKEDYRPIKGSTWIDINKLLSNPSKYLDRNKTYYFYCSKGSRSRRAVQILGVYGYNVVKVTK